MSRWDGLFAALYDQITDKKPDKPLTFFDELFDLLREIEPASFNHEISSHIESQIQALRGIYRIEEDFYSVISNLYRYFSNLYFYVTKQINTAEESGLIYSLSMILQSQFDTSLYDDALQELFDIQLTAQQLPLALMQRIKIVAELACADLYYALPRGSVSFFPTVRPVSPSSMSQLEMTIHHRATTEIHEQLLLTSIRKRRVPEAQSPVPNVRWLGCMLRQKKRSLLGGLRQLSMRKRVLFGSILALELIAIVVMGVFVPGSPLLTIPAAGVLTAKLLAVLLGSLAFVATAAAEGYVATRSCGRVFAMPQEVYRPGDRDAETLSLV